MNHPDLHSQELEETSNLIYHELFDIKSEQSLLEVKDWYFISPPDILCQTIENLQPNYPHLTDSDYIREEHASKDLNPLYIGANYSTDNFEPLIALLDTKKSSLSESLSPVNNISSSYINLRSILAACSVTILALIFLQQQASSPLSCQSVRLSQRGPSYSRLSSATIESCSILETPVLVPQPLIFCCSIKKHLSENICARKLSK
jgi:hypothetical protein